jgi:type III pantothenate kinase
MFLAIDVGNTQTAIGVFDGDTVVNQWRLTSMRDRTMDEYSVMLRGFLEPAGYTPSHFEGAAMSSVVPPVATALRPALQTIVGSDVLVVGPGIKTGLAIKIDNPREVGADRIVNSVAALEDYGAPVIIVDFGTATTFDVVDEDGNYSGGAIAPGLEVSMDGLVAATAALRRVDLVEPRSVVGKGTVEAIQSGLLYGYAGLVDGILQRIEEETGASLTVATGGLAPVITPLCRSELTVDSSLTLRGLHIIWHLNQ